LRLIDRSQIPPRTGEGFGHLRAGQLWPTAASAISSRTSCTFFFRLPLDGDEIVARTLGGADQFIELRL
jgi:hypothetical protein